MPIVISRHRRDQYEVGDLVQLQLSTGQFINGVVIDKEKGIRLNNPNAYGYMVVFTTLDGTTCRRRFFAEDIFFLNKEDNTNV
tara:strand:+ start:764 stop:1012 length:249 start_codon:yes stop_codon:yes gene_type:complete